MRISRGLTAWVIGIMIIAWSMTALAAGFLFTLDILDRSAISKLDEQKLTDAYIDAMIELEAVQTFYSKGGFTPKEYESYKDLLRFRTNLVLEFGKRKMEVPRIK